MTSQIEIDTANAIMLVVRDAVLRHLRNERAGSSASMNPAMDYLELEIVAKMRELGWTPPSA